MVFPVSTAPMATAIRQYDWSTTSLGAIEAWPIGLRTIVNLMLESSFPKALVLGRDLVTIHNDAFLTILGDKTPALGKSFAEVWSEAWATIGPIADRAFAGEATFIENFPLQVNRNGSMEQAYFTFCYSPVRDELGNVLGMMDTVVETTASVRGHQVEAVLRRELVHRVKNIMSVMGAVVNASLREASSIEEARISVEMRVEALSRAQSFLVQPEELVDLRHVVESALTPFEGSRGRVSLDGPKVSLSAQESVALSLAIYELATNAVKYGALSGNAGWIVISWSAAVPQLTFRWSEHGGPPILVPPVRAGFGSKLTNRIVPAYFNGMAHTVFEPDGLRYELVTEERPSS